MEFTGIELFSLMLPVQFASSILWSAVMLCGYGMTGEYTMNVIASITGAAIVGILGGWVVFERQNQ